MSQQALALAPRKESGGENLEFRSPCSSQYVQECNRLFGTQRHDHARNASQWSWHRSGAQFQNFARCSKARSMESFSAVWQDTDKAVVWRPTTTLSPRPLRDKRETLALRAEVVVDSTRSLVPRTSLMKNGRRNDFTSTTTHILLPKIYSASAAIANLLHRAHMPGLWRIFAFLVTNTWTAESRTVLIDGRCCAQDKNMFIQRLTRSELCSSRGYTRPLRMSFALVMTLTMDARRFQRTHLLSGMGSSLNASKETGMGVTDLSLALWIVTSSCCSVYCSGLLCSRGQIFRRMLRWQHTKFNSLKKRW